jgi:hypothetical protein
LLNKDEMKVLRKSYRPQELDEFHVLSDQLASPLIFWTGCGGILESEKLQGSMTLIQNGLVSLLSQPCDHFIRLLTTLREEFTCVVSGLSANINMESIAQGQRQCFAKKDAIRGENLEAIRKESGLRTLISPSHMNTDECCLRVALRFLLFHGCRAFETWLAKFFLTTGSESPIRSKTIVTHSLFERCILLAQFLVLYYVH